MNSARAGQYAGLLPNGKVLVLLQANPGTLASISTEVYDSGTGTWTINGSTGPTAQFDFSVTFLSTGKVLIAGCVYPRPCQDVSSAELYDPSAGASTSTASMTIPRRGHSATLLSNGQVLATGGATENNVGKFGLTNTAELYTP